MNDSPTALAPTRDSLHRLAEHILAAAVYRETGHISLRQSPGGMSTPTFGPDSTVISIDLGSLVVRSDRGERRALVTTLRAAGEFVGMTPGGPAKAYALATPCDLDAALTMDLAAIEKLASWYALGSIALSQLQQRIADEMPTHVVIWPEHLDVAISSAGVNYGFSPGDTFSDEPYVYVGPHEPPAASDFWNAPFGAFRTIGSVTSVDEAVAFLVDGHQRAAAISAGSSVTSTVTRSSS